MTGLRLEAKLYLAQRLSAMILAPLILVHLVTIITTVKGGITAAEILARTQDSLFWFSFYGLFVALAALHGAIGLRVVLKEWLPGPARLSDALALAFCLAALGLGFRAVHAVTG